jgi:hypothetical protein
MLVLVRTFMSVSSEHDPIIVRARKVSGTTGRVYAQRKGFYDYNTKQTNENGDVKLFAIRQTNVPLFSKMLLVLD